MRIITGQAKGKNLISPQGEDVTRPTSERAKQAMFSSIQFDIEGRQVLDLFAGTGQLGLEALSRGAKSAVFIDSSMDAMAIIKENAKSTGFFDKSKFLCSDYRNYLRKAASRDRFSLVILDPPYKINAVGDAIERIVTNGMAYDGCLFVCESAEADIFFGREALKNRFEILKSSHYGVAYVNILRLLPSAESDVLSEEKNNV